MANTLRDQLIIQTAAQLSFTMDQEGMFNSPKWIAQRAVAIADDVMKAMMSTASSLDSNVLYGQRVLHKKRGSTYIVRGIAKMQYEDPVFDNMQVVIYQSEEDGRIWVRPIAEFIDGRFELLEPVK